VVFKLLYFHEKKIQPMMARTRSTPNGTAMPAATVVTLFELALAEAVTVAVTVVVPLTTLVLVPLVDDVAVDGGSVAPFDRS
jgi:hypothetical protein